jgi:dihydrofolate synthase / folylpolyglutamate synthase
VSTPEQDAEPLREGVPPQGSATLAERAAAVRREILSRAPEHRIEPGLERIAAVCELMGDPQLAYPVVHVAGTNGKTSTTRMIEALLREHGLRTGRFTSPHLVDLSERICLDGEPLDDERLVAAWDDVAPYVAMVDERSAAEGGPRMVFFEVLAAMAFAAFAEAPVDVAVVEVGLGGSWDATNVVQPRVAVVTPVALDHERWLGSTIAEISAEKAGILKEGAFAVLAEQVDEAAEVLLARAVEAGSNPVREGLDFAVERREVALGGQQVVLRGLAGSYDEVFLPLHGAHQAHNAAVALAAVEAFLGGGTTPLAGSIVRAAFADVASPGRLELVRRSPSILVDAAHNPAGAAACVEAVREAFTFSRLIGVVGVVADKDARGLLAALEPLLDEVVCTRSSSPRSLPPEDLAAVAEEVFGADRVHLQERLDEALDAAVTLAEAGGRLTGGVLATGSVAVAAEVGVLAGRR